VSRLVFEPRKCENTPELSEAWGQLMSKIFGTESIGFCLKLEKGL